MKVSVTKPAKKGPNGAFAKAERKFTVELTEQEFQILALLAQGEDLESIRDIVRQSEDPVDAFCDELYVAASDNNVSLF